MQDRKSPGRGDVSEALRSFLLPLAGLRLLARERSLRRLALVPLLLSLVALAAAGGALVAFAGEIHAWAASWFPPLAAGEWYTWLWVGPLRLLAWLAAKLLFVAVAAVALVATLLVAGVAAAPFHDELSRRVERLVTGAVHDEAEPGLSGVLRDGGRALRQELLRLLYFAGVWAALLSLGVLVPGGQLVAPVLGMLFTLLFLPLDYASYTLDRRRLSFAAKRRWVRGHLGASLGFGGAAFLLSAVPGLNALAMPVLVVAGTLLALGPRAGAAAGPPRS